MRQTIRAEGHVASGFESVADALIRAIGERGEAGCAVSAYVGGSKVVDLWAGTADGRPWAQDTLTVVFSCTKGATALCAQILYDRGLLDLDAPVTRYWPEYGAAGKGKTLVRHLLTHSAGVFSYPNYWHDIGIDGSGLENWQQMTSRLAAAAPSWEPGTNWRYHGGTYGHLVGEVIRRIDGRSPGRFFAEEVAQPLCLDFFIGAPESVLPRVATVLPPPPVDPATWTAEQAQMAQMAQATMERAHQIVKAGDATAIDALPWSDHFMHPDLDDIHDYFANLANRPFIRMTELPSGNGIGGARDLARMYAPLAQGGSLDGVRLVSPESIAVFNTEQATVPPPELTFCLGYHRIAPRYSGPSATAFGHAGAGGNLGFADPERRVAFAFVKNQMRNDPAGAAADLVQAVYDCLS